MIERTIEKLDQVSNLVVAQYNYAAHMVSHQSTIFWQIPSISVGVIILLISQIPKIPDYSLRVFAHILIVLFSCMACIAAVRHCHFRYLWEDLIDRIERQAQTNDRDVLRTFDLMHKGAKLSVRQEFYDNDNPIIRLMVKASMGYRSVHLLLMICFLNVCVAIALFMFELLTTTASIGSVVRQAKAAIFM